MSETPQFETLEVHFMGSSADPRTGYCVVGVHGFTKPIGYEFATPVGSVDTRTTMVRMAGGEEVVSFRWIGAGGTIFGGANTSHRPVNHYMWDYVVAPPQGMGPPHCRLFDSVGPHAEPRKFAWIGRGHAVYDLYTCTAGEHPAQIGTFGPQNDASPTLSYRPFASFAFNFNHEPLLVDALAALALNRWLDARF